MLSLLRRYWPGVILACWLVLCGFSCSGYTGQSTLFPDTVSMMPKGFTAVGDPHHYDGTPPVEVQVGKNAQGKSYAFIRFAHETKVYQSDKPFTQTGSDITINRTYWQTVFQAKCFKFTIVADSSDDGATLDLAYNDHYGNVDYVPNCP